jgi:hypothetical protein
MQKRVSSSVLLYGNSISLDVVKTALPQYYGVPVVHVDSATPEAVMQLIWRDARLLIYDRESVNIDFVTTFQLKNPYVPVVCLDDETGTQVEVSFRENSRIETSGLPQVLQVLEERWTQPGLATSC